jgi:hypothetical protein
MTDTLPVVCPGCAAYWRITNHLDAAGADGKLRRPLGPLTQAALANVFSTFARLRSASPGAVGERADELHASVYGLIERVEADTLAAVGGLAALEGRVD